MTLYINKINTNVTQEAGNTNIFFGDATELKGTDKDANGLPLMTIVRDVARETPEGYTQYFYFDHFFPGPGQYTVSFIGENRNANIVNIVQSVNNSFYISTTLTINPAYGINRSPALLAPAIDAGAINKVFLHNPAAFDADGDSMAFRLRTCQQVLGGPGAAEANNNTPKPIDCTNYVYPDDPQLAPGAKQVPYSGVPAGDPTQLAKIVQDVYTGQITWNAPARVGLYNIAFVVEEWRRTPNGRRKIGEVIRDMQINITGSENLPPVITVPPDLCVVANTNVTFNVSATDGSSPSSPATPVTLTAYSGILPPATFRQNNTGTSVTGTFSWTPDCSRVSNQPYIVLFKAQDSPANPSGVNPPLIDEKVVRITVVGPPPQNVRAVPASSGAGLVGLVSWNSYTCQNASQLLIFRSEGPVNFNPGPCQTGIPNNIGYVQVGSVPVTATSFADDNGGKGLTRGKTYCYRLYATFPLPSGGNSIASAEACLTFNGRSAQLTNVDVNTTDPSKGQITVRWTQPRPDAGSGFGAPSGYRLGRGVGSSPTTFVPVVTITNLSDTTYVDRGLNTTANQYTYQLVFFNTTTTAGQPVEKTETAPTATSVRTSLVPDGLAKTITVNWAYQVPWDNSKQPSRIFRQNPGSTTFTQVGTLTPGATSGSFVDRDAALQLDQTYCYYVQTNGQYPLLNSANQLIYQNLLNNSQQVCAKLVATPCTPVLSIRPINCDSLAGSREYPAKGQTYQNALRWTVGSTPTGCSTAAAYYRLLRADTEAGTFVAIDSTSELTYLDRNLPKQTYCYRVQAVAANGQRSALSNVACQNDCVFFLLPNIFTPNGDGVNDLFRPKTTSPLRRTHVQIFNRWGRKVYEGDQDPLINWTGGGVAGESTSSGLVSNGIYYYLAEVEFADAAQTRRTYKGWVEVAR